MQKGLKKYFVSMDEYLASIGLYRKMIARDASCLFRAVSEQLYYSQNYHQNIRKASVNFMRANRCNFEPFVEGSFEKYLERLEDPKETAGQVEIKALSLLYKRRFIIYKYPGKSPTEIAENDYQEKILLCCSNNGHYDVVYSKHYPIDAALCQAVLYELLYSRVFGIEEVEIHAALEAFHSGGRRYRNSTSVGSEDAIYDIAEDKGRNKEDWDVSGQNRSEDKIKLGLEEYKASDAPPKVSFPYKVLKSLDPEMYRNVEFDVWHDGRKELQKTDYMVFAGRQYFLGDKCQVRLEPGGKYYNAFIQEVGHHTSAVTVFIEELGEKHLVSLTNLKPVNPVPAWNITPNRKGGTYNRITDQYAPELDHEMRGRRRFYKKARGKEMFMAVAYSRGQPGLPPRLQHSLPSGRSPPLHNPPGPPGPPGLAAYDQYRPHPPNQRPGRGYGPPRNSARFINRHHLVGPEVTYYSNPGKRCYQSFDNYSYRSRRSRRQMHCVNKECQFSFVPENGEEPQGMEGTITFYEIEEGDETAFPPLPGQAVTNPIVPTPATFWVQRGPSPIPSGKQAMTSSEEDMEERSNSEPGYQSPSVYAAAESTTNLSIQEGGSCAGSPPEGVATYSYSQQVVVNSAVISSSPGVNAAAATVFTTSSTGTSQSPVSSVPPTQSVIHPVVVSPHSIGRPGISTEIFIWFDLYMKQYIFPFVLSSLSLPYPPSAPVFVNEMGEPLSAPPPPPYSYDPSGNDLPRDYKVLQYYFNLGIQWYHQSCWNSMVQMQQLYQQPSMEQYQPYSGASGLSEQTYGEGGRAAEQRGETPTNGTTMDPSPAPHGTVYYPVIPEQCSQQPLQAYEPYVPVVPAYHYVTPWPPISQPRIHGTLCPTSAHQVGYITPTTPAAHYVPQSM
ncbi:putative bifunctional UDP-N-acetylglucosamine transferase and deubiquitinase ALG13 [Amia ocellicauda]|uniref:putative bifunctional UDP-N-acetylglucosamine transferase and deubiquitinase ALG13 n=1 Tax=Amia ocellicauda TaxID=2972642 RepID=UPI003463C2C5